MDREKILKAVGAVVIVLALVVFYLVKGEGNSSPAKDDPPISFDEEKSFKGLKIE